MTNTRYIFAGPKIDGSGQTCPDYRSAPLGKNKFIPVIGNPAGVCESTICEKRRGVSAVFNRLTENC